MMFMVTVHKGSWRRALAMLGCAVVLCGVILGANTLADGARATAAAAGGNTVKSAQDMADFLLGYGVEVDVGTAQVLQVTIPKKFDKSFRAFNEVIQSCGMDLSRHKGKMVEKWILQSPNRTVEDQTAYAVLLVRSDKVIGGYLLYQPSGEVIGLRDTLDAAALADAAASALPAQGGADADMEAAAQQECVADETGTQPAALPSDEGAADAAAEGAPPAEETAAVGEAPADDIFPTD